MVRSFMVFALAALCFPLAGQEVLRGEVLVAVEPPNPVYFDEALPSQADSLRRRGLEESALYYGAMIYGWKFHYDIGEKARSIPEKFELASAGAIVWGDPGLSVTGSALRGDYFLLQTDFYLNETQKKRAAFWKSGTVKTVQGIGSGPLGGPRPAAGWIDLKRAALEDAARAAVRALLRGQERNRPKEVSGWISLAAFPRFFADAGRLGVSARFRLEIEEIIPFAAY